MVTRMLFEQYCSAELSATLSHCEELFYCALSRWIMLHISPKPHELSASHTFNVLCIRTDYANPPP